MSTNLTPEHLQLIPNQEQPKPKFKLPGFNFKSKLSIEKTKDIAWMLTAVASATVATSMAYTAFNSPESPPPQPIVSPQPESLTPNFLGNVNLDLKLNGESQSIPLCISATDDRLITTCPEARDLPQYQATVPNDSTGRICRPFLETLTPLASQPDAVLGKAICSDPNGQQESVFASFTLDSRNIKLLP